MLGLSVMGFVSVIFNYILRCINGGLLNVMFTPKPNSISNEKTYEFDMNQKRLMSYVKGLLMISGDDLPLDVLETFPASIGGGKAGVEEARENPNREVIFIIGPVAAAIIMLIAIIGLILISFCTCATSCCHCSKGKKRKRDNRKKKSHTKSTNVDKAPDVVEVVDVQEQEKTQQVLPYSEPFNNGYDGYAYYGSDSDTVSESDSTTTYEDDEPKSFMENVKDIFPFNKAAALESMVEERQEKIMKKVEEVGDRSEFVRTHQGCFCCGCHLLTMLLAVVYVVGLVVFAIVCIMAAQQVAEVMEQPPDNEVALEEQVENWLGNKTSNYNLAGTLSFILQKTRVLLNETFTNLFTNLRGTVDNLEGKMNTTLKDDLEKLLAKLQERSGLSRVFTETVDLSSRLSNLTQLVETTIFDHESIVRDLEDLVKKFGEIHSKLEKSCASTKCSYEDDLKVLLIDFRKDNVNKPSNPEVIKNVDESFKKFATSIEDLREKMAAMPSQLVANITSELNFAEKIDSFQANISETLNEVNPKIEELNVNVKKYISESRKFVNPALYATAVVMFIIAFIFSVCLLLFIVEAFHRRLFSPTGKTPSQLAEVFRTKRRSHICGGCRFLICSILFILLIVLSLLAAVILVVCSILAVEVCPYVYMEKGMNQSDYVLNSILAGKWPTIQQQQGELLDIAPPRDILYGLSVVCVPTDKTDPKLLPSVGINEMMNLEKLLKDENFKTNVDTLIGNVAKGVSEAIPDDMLEKVKKMEQMADMLEAFLTSVRAEAAVKELAKLTGPNLKDLEDLRETLEKDNKKDELTFKEFVEALDKLKRSQGGIKKLQEDYNKFLSQSTLPDDFKAYISTTEGALKHLKDENQLKPEMEVEVTDLLSKILETVTNAVNGLVTKILPCGNMHYVLEALVATGCSSSGLVTRFFGWALALTLSILFSFLSFVGLYNLWCVQSHQIKRFYGPY